MKYSLIALLMLGTFAGEAAAQHRKINFDTISLEAARRKAAVEDKLVFVDCYTTWCIPCKHMDATVFTIDSVADYFNGKFINLKMDMDKPELKPVGKKYQVGAYPTYLLLDKNGNLVFKMVGGMSADKFMSQMKAGLNPKNEVAVMNARYAAGDRKEAFMREYILMKIRLMEIEEARKLNNELMKSLSAARKASADNWVLFGINRYAMYLSEVGSPNFNYLTEHWRDFAANVSKDTVDQKLGMVYRKIASTFVAGYFRTGRSAAIYLPADIPAFKQQIAATEMPDKKQLLLLMDMSEAAAKKEYSTVTKLLVDNVQDLSEENMHIIFDYAFMCATVPGYKYKGFSAIADKVSKVSKNDRLIKFCEDNKKKELEANAK